MTYVVSFVVTGLNVTVGSGVGTTPSQPTVLPAPRFDNTPPQGTDKSLKPLLCQIKIKKKSWFTRSNKTITLYYKSYIYFYKKVRNAVT